MVPILDELRDRLRTAGRRNFPAIARQAGVSESLLPKLMYGQRANPRVQTIQPLLDFFAAADRGEKQLTDN